MGQRHSKWKKRGENYSVYYFVYMHDYTIDTQQLFDRFSSFFALQNNLNDL